MAGGVGRQPWRAYGNPGHIHRQLGASDHTRGDRRQRDRGDLDRDLLSGGGDHHHPAVRLAGAGARAADAAAPRGGAVHRFLDALRHLHQPDHDDHRPRRPRYHRWRAHPYGDDHHRHAASAPPAADRHRDVRCHRHPGSGARAADRWLADRKHQLALRLLPEPAGGRVARDAAADRPSASEGAPRRPAPGRLARDHRPGPGARRAHRRAGGRTAGAVVPVQRDPPADGRLDPRLRPPLRWPVPGPAAGDPVAPPARSPVRQRRSDGRRHRDGDLRDILRDPPIPGGDRRL